MASILPTKLCATWAVLRFECSRMLTVWRLATTAALALFPAGLLALIKYQGGPIQRDPIAGLAMFILIPELTCMLNLLLLAAPAVHAELEGRTWTYLSVSPAGKAAVLVGKYLAAVSWATASAWSSLIVSMAVVRPESHALRLAAILAVLVPLAALAYGALYLLLGVVFLKRALTAAVAYTLVSEVGVGFIPAVVNQFTIQFHLRSLLFRWMDWRFEDWVPRGGIHPAIISTWPTSHHLIALAIFTGAFLVAAIVVLKRRELVLADQR